MLAVEYSKHIELYNDHLCYAKTIDVEKPRKQKLIGQIKKTEKRAINYLTQSWLHSKIIKMTNSSGLLARPKEIAAYLSNVQSKIQYDKKLENKVNKLDRSDKYYLVRVENGGVDSFEDLQQMIEIAKELAIGESNLASKHKSSSITLVEIGSDAFLAQTPAYIGQLKPYMNSHTINYTNFQVDSSDEYYKIYFKKIIDTPSNGILVERKQREGHEFLVRNTTTFPDSYIFKVNKDMQFKIISVNATKITYTGLYNQKSEIFIRQPLSVVMTQAQIGLNKRMEENATIENDEESKANTVDSELTRELKDKKKVKALSQFKIVDIYNLIFFNGKPIGSRYSGADLDTDVSLSSMPNAPVSVPAQAFIQKVFERVNNRDIPVVNIIMIANKGTGKSKLTKRISEFLSDMTKEPVDVISSDAFGLWRSQFSLETTANVPVDLNQIRELVSSNDNKDDSIYHLIAKQLLDEGGVSSIEDYEKLSIKKQKRYIDLMRSWLFMFAETSAVNGELYFYDQLSTHKDRTRVTIYEAHYPTLDADMPRTELTCRVLPPIDSRTGVINRDKNPYDLLLYDTYDNLDSMGHVCVYPSDWEYYFGIYH